MLLPLLVALVATAAGQSSTVETTVSTSQQTSPSTQQVTAQTGQTGQTQNTLPADNYNFQVKILNVDNPEGTLASGAPCSPFSFVGTQCSMKLQVCVKNYGESCEDADYQNVGQISQESNWAKIVSKSIKVDLPDGIFNGFSVGVRLGQDGVDDIDSYTFQVQATSSNGYTTYTSQRANTMGGTSIKVAWISQAAPPVTTAMPMSSTGGTTGTTVITTQTTAAPTTTTTPFMANDCDDYMGDQRTNGVKPIYIKDTFVDVYCEYGTNGAYTAIQSRGSADNTLFNGTFDDYKSIIGSPGKGNNFWLGLDNIFSLTTSGSYDLLIDLCCNGVSSAQQRYFNFTIGDASTKYTLHTTPDRPAVGLDLHNANFGPPYNGKDIGSPFATYDTLSEDFVDTCDILRYYDSLTSDTPLFNNQTGGWWFGSCGNNLNGDFLSSYNTTQDSRSQCALNQPFTTGAGIELTTTSGPVGGRYFDGVSYDRVRMAIYKSGQIPMGIKPNSFCS